MTTESQELDERLGLLADKAANYREYGLAGGGLSRLPYMMRIEAMFNGLTELRDELRGLAIQHGLDETTWASEPGDPS